MTDLMKLAKQLQKVDALMKQALEDITAREIASPELLKANLAMDDVAPILTRLLAKNGRA